MTKVRQDRLTTNTAANREAANTFALKSGESALSILFQYSACALQQSKK